jgi:hypothetical protein
VRLVNFIAPTSREAEMLRTFAVIASGNDLLLTTDSYDEAISDARRSRTTLGETVEVRRVNVFGDAYDRTVVSFGPDSSVTAAKVAEAERFFTDRAYRESLPWSEQQS